MLAPNDGIAHTDSRRPGYDGRCCAPPPHTVPFPADRHGLSVTNPVTTEPVSPLL